MVAEKTKHIKSMLKCNSCACAMYSPKTKYHNFVLKFPELPLAYKDRNLWNDKYSTQLSPY